MPRAEKTAELNPCPFCGNKADLVEKNGLPGWSWWKVVCGCCLIGTEEYPLKSAAIKAWNRRYEPPNLPLTLDELKEMDGQPVWIVGVSCINNFKGHWDICDLQNGEVIEFSYCIEQPDLHLLGISWWAYRRKPEEDNS